MTSSPSSAQLSEHVALAARVGEIIQTRESDLPAAAASAKSLANSLVGSSDFIGMAFAELAIATTESAMGDFEGARRRMVYGARLIADRDSDARREIEACLLAMHAFCDVNLDNQTTSLDYARRAALLLASSPISVLSLYAVNWICVVLRQSSLAHESLNLIAHTRMRGSAFAHTDAMFAMRLHACYAHVLEHDLFRLQGDHATGRGHAELALSGVNSLFFDLDRRSVRTPRFIAYAHLAAGEAHRRLGHREEALDALNKADSHFGALNIRFEQERIKIEIFLADLLQPNKEKLGAAITHFKKNKQNTHTLVEQEILFSLAECARACGDLTLENALLRELFSNEIKNRITLAGFADGAASHRAETAQTAKQQAQVIETLTEIATVDSLTGLINRRTFETRFDAEFSRVSAMRQSLFVLLIDVDHFKQVNDQHSHAVGDAVLRTFAQVITQAARRDSVVARYGGDEFAALISAENAGAALAAGQRLVDRVNGYPWSDLSPHLRITTSIGIAQHIANASLAQTLHAADAALYQAKADGRSCVRVFVQPLAGAPPYSRKQT